jgi:hypothetical protein
VICGKNVKHIESEKNVLKITEIPASKNRILSLEDSGNFDASKGKKVPNSSDSKQICDILITSSEYTVDSNGNYCHIVDLNIDTSCCPHDEELIQDII